MIQLPNNSIINYIIGSEKIKATPSTPFNEISCSFLNELSSAIRKSKETKQYPDIATFGFWCRNGNIQKLKKELLDQENRLGLGLVFHITPSNIPINFAFSFAFGLLSGNSNIVRLPSNSFPQVDLLCSLIKETLNKEEFTTLKDSIAFIKYPIDDSITEAFSIIADGRMLWGGDSSISKIKKLESKTRTKDMIFSDRYSLSVINSETIISADEKELSTLINNFYNDTYLMDQNACSSPSFVIWTGKDTKRAKEIFWSSISESIGSRYEIETIHVMDKFTKLCLDAANHIGKDFSQDSKFLYRVQLTDEISPKYSQLKGNSGYFYEYETKELNKIKKLISDRCQTLTYYGEDKEKLKDFVLSNKLLGIDRIVPIGQALNIGPIWDGQNLVLSLSRIIHVS